MSYCSAIVRWNLVWMLLCKKINALSCSKPIHFAIDHLYDFSHNILNLSNILSRQLGCHSLFFQERSRNQQRLFRRDLETSKSKGCLRRSCHYNSNSGYFWCRTFFFQLFIKLIWFFDVITSIGKVRKILVKGQTNNFHFLQVTKPKKSRS